MGSILKIKKADGNIANVPIISGESAYEAAVRLGSYEGTEQEFAQGLAAAADLGDTILLPPTGTAIKPIYIDSNHNIQPITHTIESDVPSNAKFTDTNTTYTAATGGGLSLDGTSFSLETLSGMSASNYGSSDGKTLTYGDTFKIPYITTDTKGRITAISEKTMTMPAAPSTDTGITLTETGSATRPIYIDSTGTPKQINYTIKSNVPENAKFTDTNTTYTVQTDGGLGMTDTSLYLADIAGLASGTIGNNTTKTLNFGDTIKIPKLTINSKGQATSIEDISLTLPSAPIAYVLPTASSSTLGGVKTGASLSNTSGYTACPIDSNGVIYYQNAPATYILPTASSSTLGGVKTGTTISDTSDYTACPIDSNGVIYYKTTSTSTLSFTSADAGKVLMVDDDGSIIAANLSYANTDTTGF